jgi:hypothetical protein
VTQQKQEGVILFLNFVGDCDCNKNSFRFNRGVTSLNGLLKQARSGKPIAMENIPPPLADSNKAIQST